MALPVPISVQSSDVESIMYDEDTRLLQVTFIKNGPYTYFQVPPSVFSEMVDADSKGKFVWKVLRTGAYPYQRGPMAAFLTGMTVPSLSLE
jgi:KTSC domain